VGVGGWVWGGGGGGGAPRTFRWAWTLAVVGPGLMRTQVFAHDAEAPPDYFTVVIHLRD
jgi:hypothetical protein